jgi:hypothetical protein
MKSRKPRYDRAGVSSNPEQPPHPGDRVSAAPKLEYFGVSAPRERYGQWRGFWFIDLLSAPTDPQMRKWWVRRACYYIGVFVMFLIGAFYVGPNELLLGKIMYPYQSLADYVPEVEKECVPVVRAVKEYQRDHGRLPADLSDVGPRQWPFAGSYGYMLGDQFILLKGDHRIYYDFTPGSEGWRVFLGPIEGPIPAPIVTVGPATGPTTVPAQ